MYWYVCIKGLKCINIECLTFKMIFSGIVNCLIITKKNWKFNENIDLEQIPKFSRFLLDHLRNSTKYSYLLSRFQYLVYTNDSIHRFYNHDAPASARSHDRPRVVSVTNRKGTVGKCDFSPEPGKLAQRRFRRL